MNDSALSQRDRPPILRLDAADLISPTWRKLVRHYEDRLQQCYQRNAGPLNMEDTSKIRGQIMEIEALLRVSTVKTEPDGHQYRVTDR